MRIIAGEWRGRTLQGPSGLATRPTADRVREALFSMLTSRLGSFDGLRVADLFAGTGALGFEALSRGAASVTFVEIDSTAAAAIRANAATLGAGDRARILTVSALALPKSEAFDLILADPPYEHGSGTAVVEAIAEAGWLAPGGWLAIESERSDPLESGEWDVDVERRCGRARLTLIRRP